MPIHFFIFKSICYLINDYLHVLIQLFRIVYVYILICFMTSCVVLCTCILPVVYLVVILFFHFVGQWSMIRMGISYYIYYAHYLILFQVDGY